MRRRKNSLTSQAKKAVKMATEFFKNWSKYSLFECGLLGAKHGSVLILGYLVTQDLTGGNLGNAVFKTTLLSIIFISSVLQARKMLKKQLYGNFVR